MNADELRAWTAAVARSRAEYHAHPTLSEWCHGKCPHCRARAKTTAAQRMQAMRDRRKEAL